ncbi:mtDNA inheritance protein [Sporothrix brasiliensis 5110]|uniref:MtDNA inheritance protein n=1 Tax=Sporothrix brasiliensis 5110 TaxID=1398154 RepID=A0A0C2IYX6_9PEZI|nr:mtDNA inheritance protein [Sporothrix brasiliensis 5110]KIH91930.1 mtDNA inheritance protein [Sporothrix brasiliensis 5110]
MHEIITLQLGRQSNYVAAHFWNAQESYFTYGQDDPSPVDHDIHWRAGIGADGSETYLPRTVVYDRKGGFGSLRKVNALYEAQEEAHNQQASAMDLPSSLWHGRTVVQRETPILPSAYTQSLDTGLPPTEPLTPATVRYWSDYSRVYYHPRSLIEVGDEPDVSAPQTATNGTNGTNGAQLGTAASTGAAQPREYTWGDGESLFAELDREHDLLDRDLRPFVEEADQMQGFQVMASVDDSWGGFAARYLERMRDEYGKVDIWLWALQQPAGRLPREKRITRLANKARTLVEAYSQASLVIPLAVPPTPLTSVLPSTFDSTSTWHTAALLATAIETATLPARLRRLGSGAAGQSGDSLAYLTDLLNATGKQTVANLQMSVVQPWQSVQKDARERREAAGYDEDDDGGGDSTKMDGNLQLPIDFAPRDESVVVAGRAGRGVRAKKPRMFGQAVVTRATPGEDGDGDNKGGGGGEDDDESQTERRATLDRRDMMHRRFALKPVSQRYTVPLGFPLLDSFPYIYQQTSDSTASIPVTTALATDRAVADRIQTLRTTVTVGAPWAVGLEDREALGNDLAGMADAYHDGWSSGSDAGDDED